MTHFAQCKTLSTACGTTKEGYEIARFENLNDGFALSFIDYRFIVDRNCERHTPTRTHPTSVLRKIYNFHLAKKNLARRKPIRIVAITQIIAVLVFFGGASALTSPSVTAETNRMARIF